MRRAHPAPASRQNAGFSKEEFVAAGGFSDDVTTPIIICRPLILQIICTVIGVVLLCWAR